MLSLCQKAFTIGTLRNVITAVNDSFDTALGGLTQAALSGCGLCPRVCEWQYHSSMHVPGYLSTSRKTSPILLLLSSSVLLLAQTSLELTFKVPRQSITLTATLSDCRVLMAETMASLDKEIYNRISIPKLLWPLVFRNNSDVLRRAQSIRSVSCQPTLCMT